MCKRRIKEKELKKYERKEIYTIEHIRELTKDVLFLPAKDKKKLARVNLDGDFIEGNNKKYQTFFIKGLKCIDCGIEGEYFAKERLIGEDKYHLNLYAKDDNDNEILMTKNHITQKSQGGKSYINNCQTMCMTCNRKRWHQLNQRKDKKSLYCAYITTLKGLRKHSNADRLQCATVFGNNVIVDLSYMEGQRIVFFPTDGQLSEEFACDNNLVIKKDEQGNNVGGYLHPNKRNITTLKLRGEKSEGLALPIDVLSKYVNINQLKDGEQITVLNGVEICRKYIPIVKERIPHEGSNKKNNKKKEKISYPFFSEHSDTSQLAYSQGAFEEGDICYITLKMHGTSARTANTIEVVKKKRRLFLKKVFKFKDKEIRQFKCVSGTRRTTLKHYDGGYYGSNTFRQKFHDMFKDRLPKGVEVFYEIVGWDKQDHTIMGTCSNTKIKDKEFSKQYGKETVFSYDCNVGENDCYVYRMTMTNEDGYCVEMPWERVVIECEKMGIKCVPTFEKFIFTTWEDLMQRVEKYYDGADPIGKTHIREGVVVRIDNREKFTAYKHKNFHFKCLEGIIKDVSEEPDMEEAEELIKSEE